jgi:hypothetical protein
VYIYRYNIWLFNSTKVWVPFQSFRSWLQRMLAFCVYNLLPVSESSSSSCVVVAITVYT